MITGWKLFLKNIQGATSFNPLDKLNKNKTKHCKYSYHIIDVAFITWLTLKQSLNIKQLFSRSLWNEHV